MERVTGIEPVLSAWEAEILPLNYTRYVSAVPASLPVSLWRVSVFDCRPTASLTL